MKREIMKEVPILYIFSGLPGVGKSTLASRLAEATGAVYLRIDTIEQALRDLCGLKVEGEGYWLAYPIAGDNLRLGKLVVADSCNPIELTRREWEQVAIDTGVNYRNIEIVCSDLDEHKRRALSRMSDIPGLALPEWGAIQTREYHDWTVDRIVVDTAGQTVELSFEELLRKLV
jgi:predicted kinase